MHHNDKYNDDLIKYVEQLLRKKRNKTCYGTAIFFSSGLHLFLHSIKIILHVLSNLEQIILL